MAYLGNTVQAKSRKSKGYKRRGNPNTYSREKVKREGKRTPLERG